MQFDIRDAFNLLEAAAMRIEGALHTAAVRSGVKNGSTMGEQWSPVASNKSVLRNEHLYKIY